MTDNRVFNMLTQIAACLCVQNEAAVDAGDSDPLCFCGVVPGIQVAFDTFPECEGRDGQAWVRLGPAYPALGPGQPDQTAGNCNKQLGFDVNVGIVRSWQADPESSDGSSTPALMAAMVKQQTVDMFTMLKAIKCCEAVEDDNTVVGQYIPIGPEGLVYGGMITLYVAS